MIACQKCNDPIVFSDSWVSERSGKSIPLDESTHEPHICPNSTFVNQVLQCKYCQSKITFSVQVISPRGKKIPLNEGTLQKHECKEGKEAWKNNQKGTLNCRLCGEALMFSEDRKSESNKYIPIEVRTNENHNCPKRKFNPNRR
jgi:hypothetical protein